MLTFLTSHGKSGKTTLLSILLSRLKTGGELAGLPLVPGKVVVVSEETPALWQERHRLLDFGTRRIRFLCQPFSGKPSPAQWQALIDRLAALRHSDGIDLVVIDSLAHFYPGADENNAVIMMETLLPLQRLRSLGLSVLILLHPGKGKTAPGEALRGSSVLLGSADIIIEMGYYVPGAATDRRRRLRGFSRFTQTPRHLVIELNAAGTDYRSCGDEMEVEFGHSWQVLRLVLEDADGKLTRRAIQAEWPPDFIKPAQVSLWRYLDQAVARGLVRQDGTGRKSDPFRYWLPEKEAQWLQDPLYVFEEEQLARLAKAQEANRGPPVSPETGAADPMV
jgi:hypothetical protein